MADNGRARAGGGVVFPIAPQTPQMLNSALPGLSADVNAGIVQHTPADWFGPGNPLFPTVPTEVHGRSWDFQPAFNLALRPRKYEEVTFQMLRGLANAHDLMRTVIETRKDQMAAITWSIGSRDDDNPKLTPAQQKRADAITSFFEEPQRGKDFATWMRLLMEDLLVIDAPTLYPRKTRGGGLYELRVFDGATINRMIDDWGETPEPPAPAYQQILHGQPLNFRADELIYKPRNQRPGKPFGFSPVEQVITIVNIAIRRQLWQLNYFVDGSLPDALIGTPLDWTPDQIRIFQDDWDAKQANRAGGRHGARFVPGEVAKGYVNMKETPLFGEAEEWIARVICFAFSISPQPFTKQMNRATAEVQKEISVEEGLQPLKAWFKSLIDNVVKVYFASPDLELQWDEEEEIDQQTLSGILVNEVKFGLRSIDEARASIGLDAVGKDFAKPMVYTPQGYMPVNLDDQIANQKKKEAAFPPPDPIALAAARAGGSAQGRPPPNGRAPTGGGGSSGQGAGRAGGPASDTRKGAEAGPLAAKANGGGWDHPDPGEPGAPSLSGGADIDLDDWLWLSKYSPDQPRDDHGRWTSGGGLSPVATQALGKDGVAHLQGLIDSHAPAGEILHALEPAARMADAIPPTTPPGKDPTAEMLANRVYAGGLDANQAIDKLVADSHDFAGPNGVMQGRQAILVLGPPASGKSTIAEALATRTGSAIWDSDEAKKLIPEYRGGIGAAAVHEESKFLSDEAGKRLVGAGDNLIIPLVGANPDKIAGRVAGLKANGYKVFTVNMAVSNDTAAARMAARFLRTGRLISPSYFAEVAGKPQSTYNALKSMGAYGDGYAQVDGNGPPRAERVVEATGNFAGLTPGGSLFGGVRRFLRGPDQRLAAGPRPLAKSAAAAPQGLRARVAQAALAKRIFGRAGVRERLATRAIVDDLAARLDWREDEAEAAMLAVARGA